MSVLTINTITEKDMGKFSRGKQSKLILEQRKPKAPLLSKHVIEVTSGKRKGLQPKNDPVSQRKSEKLLSSRMPKVKNGKIHNPVRKLKPIKVVDEDSKKKEVKDPLSSEKKINSSRYSPRENENRRRKELERSNSAKREKERNKNRRSEERVETDKEITDDNKDVYKDIKNRKLVREKDDRRNKSNDRYSYNRRSDDIYRSNRRGSDDRNHEKRGKERYSNRRDTSSRRRNYNMRSIDRNKGRENGYRDRKDNRRKSSSPTRAIRPRSPHRHKAHKNPGIKISGNLLDSEEVDDLDTSSQSIDNNQEIKVRQKVLDKHLEEKYPDNSFSPEDDTHLKDAIDVALNENKAKHIRDAMDKGYELEAKVLESMKRPDALEEVIEEMVSNRREKIREKQQTLRRDGVKPRSERKTKKHGKEVKRSKEDEKELDDLISKFSDYDGGKKSGVKRNNDRDLFDRMEKQSEDPIIETVDENSEDDAEEEEINSNPKGNLVQDNNLPGDKIDLDEYGTNYRSDKHANEKNVRLPNATRSRNDRDKRELPDALGQRDTIYDPLGVDTPFGKYNDEVGDGLYEESSEEEEKLTIDEKKDDMIYRFKLIRETYPTIALPRITKKMKLAKMVRIYEHIMSRVKLKVKTGNFKIFLIGGFLIWQFLGNKMIGNDMMSGFTVNQMYSIKRYERILREFGESDWTSIGIELPAIVRLPIFMTINAGIFVLAKFIFKRTGKDYSEQFHRLYGQLTGGDDYVYIKDETGSKGLDAGDDGDGGGGLGGLANLFSGGGGGGMFGMIKTFLGMMGGGGGGGDEKVPKRSEATGPSYVRKKNRRKKKE